MSLWSKLCLCTVLSWYLTRKIQNRRRRAQRLVISIEGNIGSGKSTLVRALQQTLPVAVYEEPVDSWTQLRDEQGRGLLQAYYADMAAVAFPMQMAALFTRFSLAREALAKSRVAIMERSIYADRQVFAAQARERGHISHLQGQIYDMWHAYFCRQLPTHVLIYLNTPPDVCASRVKHRDRAGEDQLSAGALQVFHDSHETFVHSGVHRCHSLDGTLTPEALATEASRIILTYLE